MKSFKMRRRYESFEHDRFRRIRRGFQAQVVNQNINMVVNSGFYFAQQGTVRLSHPKNQKIEKDIPG